LIRNLGVSSSSSWNGMYSLEQDQTREPPNPGFIFLGENLKRTCGSKSSFIGGEFCPQKKIKSPPPQKARKQTKKKLPVTRVQSCCHELGSSQESRIAFGGRGGAWNKYTPPVQGANNNIPGSALIFGW